MAVKKKPAPKKPAKKVAAKKPAVNNNKKAAAKPAPKKAAKPAAKKPVAKSATKKPSPKPAPKKAAAAPAKKPAVSSTKNTVSKKSVVPVKPNGHGKAVVAKPAGNNGKAPAKLASATAKAAPINNKTSHAAGKGTTKPMLKAAPAAAAKPAAKPAPAPVKPAVVAKPAEVVVPLKKGMVDPKSLVSIKPKVQPVVKKEPPKPSKIVIPKTTTKSSVKYEPDFTKSVLDANRIQHPLEGPTQRYSDADLAEFKEIIMRKLDAAKKELNYLQGLITRKDEGGDMDDARYMTMEDGSVSMEREQLSQMASRQITFIDHLEKALMRIENKTYGICRITGKLIGKDRLRAVPHATLSIEAKELRNK